MRVLAEDWREMCRSPPLPANCCCLVKILLFHNTLQDQYTYSYSYVEKGFPIFECRDSRYLGARGDQWLHDTWGDQRLHTKMALIIITLPATPPHHYHQTHTVVAMIILKAFHPNQSAYLSIGDNYSSYFLFCLRILTGDKGGGGQGSDRRQQQRRLHNIWTSSGYYLIHPKPKFLE